MSTVSGFGAIHNFKIVVLMVAALATCTTSIAQEDHVSFLVMGKTTNHRQSAGGELTLLNYHFFAEVFVKEGGVVNRASLDFPDGQSRDFEDLGFVQEVHGGRYMEETELDRLYPNGDYMFRLEIPNGPMTRVLTVRGTGREQSRIPGAVRVMLRQGGQDASPNSVDPDEDLEVTWSPFVTGETDQNGIVDDLLFVVVGDCRGEKIVHSGRPFEGTPYLTYTTKSYVVPAAKLAPGEPHQLFVEHAKVDTSMEAGVVGLVTYAATTFLDFKTIGADTGEPCPRSMPRIDQGQTDR